MFAVLRGVGQEIHSDYVVIGSGVWILRLIILEGELVIIRSKVFPCLCVGTLIIYVKFLLYTILHKETL